MTDTTTALQSARPGATAHSRELGGELRRERKRANLKGIEVCLALEWSTAKLSKLEAGLRGTSRGEIGALLGRYGSAKETRDRILRMAAEEDRGCFVRPHGGLPPDHLLCLQVHERLARSVSSYEPLVVPDLAQTAEYTRALFPTLPDFVVDQREARQEDLRTGRRISLFLTETALANQVGDARVMHDQLMRLVFMCDWQEVDVRLVPVRVGGHLSPWSSSALLTFAPGVRPLACASTETATVFMDDGEVVRFYEDKHRTLGELALSSARSRAVLERWAARYDIRR